MIPYSRQSISEADIAAVVSVLRSDFITQGPVVPRFEQTLTAYCGSRHGIAVNSGTAALHIACLALGVGPGDRVWTSPISFVASANCARYCGAEVDFVDIEPETGNLSVAELEEKLQHAERDGRLPKVVIPVHFAGLPCAMQEIHALGQRYGFAIIEDACHALGAHADGAPTGSCRYSDITVFSFHPVKIITTGEGGMALTNDPGLARTMALLRSHGITRETGEFVQPSPGPWYYEQQMLGFNYRMSDIQAALGISQMARLDAWTTQRQALASRYRQALTGLTAAPLTDRQSACHLYVHHVDATQRRRVFEALRTNGIAANVHYIPIPCQPYYAQRAVTPCPKASTFYESSLSLPLFPDLTAAEQERVISVLRDNA